jgi:flagellar biosynthetic protein FliR
MIQASSSIFITGLRLVLPLLALLLMVEISLALLTRLNSQLHLMQISMPIKMLLSLILLGWLLLVFPQVFAQSASRTMQLVYSLLSV